MGASGAGKTTLLNSLARQLPAAKGLRLSGHIRINGQPALGAAFRQGYIQQEDLFYSQLTVRCYAQVMSLLSARSRRDQCILTWPV